MGVGGVHSALGGRLWFEPAFCPQYVAELRLHPEKLNMSLEELPPALRQDNFSLPNGSVLLQQLDTIDNAACGWIQFMSKVGCASRLGSAGAQARLQRCPFPQVSVDIFKGFPDEESIVNYTLNQAYQDNVTVFASEPGLPASPPVPPRPSPWPRPSRLCPAATPLPP